MNILMAVLLISENIVDIQNVITVLVIISIIFDAFTWFSKNTSRISR